MRELGDAEAVAGWLARSVLDGSKSSRQACGLAARMYVANGYKHDALAPYCGLDDDYGWRPSEAVDGDVHRLAEKDRRPSVIAAGCASVRRDARHAPGHRLCAGAAAVTVWLAEKVHHERRAARSPSSARATAAHSRVGRSSSDVPLRGDAAQRRARPAFRAPWRLGWRWYLVDRRDAGEPLDVVVLCPDCAAREFGE
jgi:hypothetical protein